MADEVRVFPRASAFEALLAKVYLELWDIQDNPSMFVRRVETFVKVFLPTMFRNRIKLDNLNEKLLEMLKRIEMWETTKQNADPLTEDAINQGSIPAEEAEFAREVLHETIDILTEAGFNFPVATKKPRRQMRA